MKTKLILLAIVGVAGFLLYRWWKNRPTAETAAETAFLDDLFHTAGNAAAVQATSLANAGFDPANGAG